jgi:hypothetical protein
VKCYLDSEAYKLKLHTQGRIFFYRKTDSVHNFFWYDVKLRDTLFDSASLATYGIIWNCIAIGPKNFQIGNYYYFAHPCWSDYHSETNKGDSFQEMLEKFMAQNFPRSPYLQEFMGRYRKINE